MSDSCISWDKSAQKLTGWVVRGGTRIEIAIPRDLIHAIPLYNDAIEKEIEQFKADIVERLFPK